MTNREESRAEAPNPTAAEPGKYLTFRLGEDEYGIGILKVQEIIGIMNVTHVPRTPDYVRGVINLRGKVIPVVDLRIKFGKCAAGTGQERCSRYSGQREQREKSAAFQIIHHSSPQQIRSVSSVYEEQLSMNRRISRPDLTIAVMNG